MNKFGLLIVDYLDNLISIEAGFKEITMREGIL